MLVVDTVKAQQPLRLRAARLAVMSGLHRKHMLGCTAAGSKRLFQARVAGRLGLTVLLSGRPQALIILTSAMLRSACVTEMHAVETLGATLA